MKYSISTTITIAFFTAGLLMLPLQTSAQNFSYTTENDWSATLNGSFPVFFVASNAENYSSNGDDQLATRIMSGFNPANITAILKAPNQNGIDVSGVFQINNHLQGAGIQNDGLFESRIAEIIISGNFGTVNAGKGFGIFNSSSIGDNGSAMGVGRFGGPDAADATLGRIGTGYTYANFNPRLTYTTPDMNGLTIKAGIINPEKPNGADNRSADIETSTPRLEAQIDYLADLDAGSAQFWAGGLYQKVDVVAQNFDYTISGWELGSKLQSGNVTLMTSYSQTNSIGADGLIGLNISGGTGLDQAEVDARQWYTEGTYDFGKILLGVSYGEGSQQEISTEVGSSPDITNTLAMGFARISMTDNLTFMIELQNFSSDAQSDYQAVVLGTQFDF